VLVHCVAKLNHAGLLLNTKVYTFAAGHPLATFTLPAAMVVSAAGHNSDRTLHQCW
jgi:hypothetical protein